MLKEFREFLLKGNVIDLAIGVIIGGAFAKIVDSLVKDVFMPVIGIVLGKIDFNQLFYLIKDGKQPPAGGYPSLDAAIKDGASVMAYGSFINNIITFVIIGFVIFMLVRSTAKYRALLDVPAGPTPTEALLTEIRDSLKK